MVLKFIEFYPIVRKHVETADRAYQLQLQEVILH